MMSPPDSSGVVVIVVVAVVVTVDVAVVVKVLVAVVVGVVTGSSHVAWPDMLGSATNSAGT